MSVSVVHLMPTLMERQLDIAAGALLHRELEGRGIAFFTNSQTEQIVGGEQAEAVLLADGPAPMVAQGSLGFWAGIFCSPPCKFRRGHSDIFVVPASMFLFFLRRKMQFRRHLRKSASRR